MKGYIPLIIIMLTIVGGIIWLFVYSGTKPIFENPQIAIGCITGFKQAQKTSGLDAVVVFQANGNDYEIRISSLKYKANVKGEKFKIKYEKMDPAKNIILKHEPVFISGEKTKIVEGTITRLYQFNWFVDEEQPKEGVEFEYLVNDKIVKKAQELPPNYKSQFLTPTIGGSYEVEYWVENPQRAIIHLNKQLKK